MPPLDFPNSPTNGQSLTGAAGEVWTWDGVKWAAPGGSSAGGPVGGNAYIQVSDTAPLGLSNGALWFDSAGLQLYINYNDGNSLQWVSIVNQAGDASVYGITKNDRSGAITLGNSAQQLMAANTARRGWSFQNKSTTDMWFNDLGGTADPTANNSTYMPPGAYYESEENGASITSVSIIGAATGAQYVAKEW